MFRTRTQHQNVVVVVLGVKEVLASPLYIYICVLSTPPEDIDAVMFFVGLSCPQKGPFL